VFRTVAKAGKIAAQRTIRRDARRGAQITRTREEIVEAAARCLARSGFNAVSMQEIAAEVGFTAPALYMYFESRDAIFEELFLTIRRELAAIFESPDPERPARGAAFPRRLAALVRRQLEWMERRRDVFQAVMAMRMRTEPWRPQTGSQAGEPLPILHARLLKTWLAAEARTADVGGYDPGEAALFLLGTMQGFIWRWLKAPASGQRLSDETNHILALFLHGVLGAQAALKQS
jgi:AcrR family transcriptional regulator